MSRPSPAKKTKQSKITPYPPLTTRTQDLPIVVERGILQEEIRKALTEQNESKKKTTGVANNRVLIFLCLLALPALIMAFLWITYIQPHNHPPLVRINESNISVGIKTPKYAAVGDESYLDVILINNGSSTVNGIATVTLSGNAAWPLPDETTAVKIDNLAAGERRSKRIKFTIAKEPIFSDSEVIDVGLQTDITSPETSTPPGATPDATSKPSSQNSAVTKIAIGPIPYLKSVFLYIVSGNFLLGLAAFIWSKFRSHVLKDREEAA